MEGKNFLGMDREMRTALGVSYVIWLAMLIAVVAMLNSRLTQTEAAISANWKAIEANWEIIEANNAAIADITAQAAANHATREANGAARETLFLKIKKLISMILELLDELDAIGGDDVETKVETYRAR